MLRASLFVLGLAHAYVSQSSWALYFGTQCFSDGRLQEQLEDFERKVLGSADGDLTVQPGHFGSVTGADTCSNGTYSSDRSAEVVKMNVPLGSLEEAFSAYLGMLTSDEDGEDCRAVVGVPGGFNNARARYRLKNALAETTRTLSAFRGDPANSNSTVYVMDTLKFPFHAEEQTASDPSPRCAEM
jgi:hypothetical protein